jgi:hypothetical protein
MSDINSTQTGNWATGSTWVGGVAPGPGDVGIVKTSHDVTVATAEAALGITIDGGHLILNADFTFDDNAAALFTIKSTSGGAFSSNGSKADPRKMKSENANPTNPWKMRYEDQTGADDRDLDFDFIERLGALWYLGNDDNEIHFNGGGVLDPSVASFVPLSREPNLVEHRISGRKYGRVHHDSTNAGIITIAGTMPLEGWDWLVLRHIIDDQLRVALFTRFDHIPHGRVERPSFSHRPGQFLPFSITVREDK